MVLLGLTVARSGQVFNREIITADQSDHILNRQIATAGRVRDSGYELENQMISLIDRAQPLPPFPASMAEAKLDLIVPIYRAEIPTPPDPRIDREGPILRFPR
jgi:hypothetical protein